MTPGERAAERCEECGRTVTLTWRTGGGNRVRVLRSHHPHPRRNCSRTCTASPCKGGSQPVDRRTP